LVGSPSGGTWSVVSGGGTISGNTYTPANIASNTSVTIRYTIAAASGCNASTADVTFTVTPVNNLPTAVNDTATVNEDSTSNVINVLTNDSFGGDGPNIGAISIPSATSANGGTVAVNTNGTPNDPTDDTLVYTPAANFNGTDTFDYTITD
ncbi:gliding motility-associated C-terminal domain-containing protein, partial [Polaribacter sp. BAL334]|uniref:Ig-like domain-containing protein n=1 Tax=Polaribacter sp. BAL334 TaxID=1708178 RepID=UPI001A30E450